MGYILKAIDKEEKVRFALAITTDLVEEARKNSQHKPHSISSTRTKSNSNSNYGIVAKKPKRHHNF